jgi:hypothetical protein
MHNPSQLDPIQVFHPAFSLDEADSTAFNEIAKTNNLPQEDVEKLLAIAARVSARGGEGALAALNESFSKARAQWREAVFNDPEIGGEKSEEAARWAGCAVDRFGTPDLAAVFNSGWGDHPAVVKFCVAVGKALCAVPKLSEVVENV